MSSISFSVLNDPSTGSSFPRQKRPRTPESVSLVDAIHPSVNSGYWGSLKTPKKSRGKGSPNLDELHFVQLGPQDYPDAAKTVGIVWAKIARERSQKAGSPVEKDKILDSWSITKQLGASLRTPSPTSKAFYCLDGRHTPQGMMVVSSEESSLTVNFLATHPNNIPLSGESESNSIRGVGTSLLKKAEKLAEEDGFKELRLTPTSSARTFYEARGFRSLTDSSTDLCKEINRSS